MIRASFLAMTALVGLAQASETNRYATQTADSVIENASVRVADSVQLPAKEPGVLVHLPVKEGSMIRAGQKIGQIDDSEPKMQKKAAHAAWVAAYKRATDRVEITYSEAAAAVAKEDYEQLVETNRRAERAVTAVDLRRAKLEWDRSTLAIKKAIHEHEIAQYEARIKEAEVEAADMAIDRRAIKAPFDGIVEEMHRKQDEWVNPGDPILYLLRLDTMEVEGRVDPAKYDPHELQDCEVTVVVQLARGQKETVRGRITKVSSMVGLDKKYEVRAEVANRQEHGTWILRDGHLAVMTIHLGTSGQAAGTVSQAP